MSTSSRWQACVLIIVSVLLLYICVLIYIACVMEPKTKKSTDPGKYPAKPNLCPSKNPYLYFLNFGSCTSLQQIAMNECPSPKVCLENCPGITYAPDLSTKNNEEERERWKEMGNYIVCLRFKNFTLKENAPKSFDDYVRQVMDGFCPKAVYKCNAFFNKICLPTELDEEIESVLLPQESLDAMDVANRTSASLFVVRRSKEMFVLWISISSFIAAFFIITFILLFMYFVRCTVYASLVTYAVLLLIGFGYSTTMTVVCGFNEYIPEWAIYMHWGYWLIITLLFVVYTYLYYDFVQKCYYNIPKAIKFLTYANRGLGGFKSSFFFILLGILIQVILVTILLYHVYLVSKAAQEMRTVLGLTPECICINEYKEGSICTEPKLNAWCRDRISGKKCIQVCCHLNSLKYSADEITLIAILAVTTYYLMWFVKGAVDMILGTTIVHWYRDNFSTHIPFKHLAKKTVYCLKYQSATLSVGSIVMCLLGVFHVTLQFAEHLVIYSIEMKRIRRKTCVMSSLDKLSKLTSSLTYVIAGVYNLSFWEASRRVDLTMTSKIRNIRLINKLVDMVLFICALVVLVSTLIAIIVTYLWPQMFIQKVESLSIFSLMNDPQFIIIIMVVATYFIVANVLSMYSVSVNAIFLTYISDVPAEISRKRKYDSSKIISGEVNPDKFDLLGKLNDLGETVSPDKP